MGITCGKAVEIFAETLGFSIENDGLFIHDFFHVILGRTQLDRTKENPYLTDEAELVTILTQMVVMNDPRPHPEVEKIMDGGKTPFKLEAYQVLHEAMCTEFMGRKGYTPLSASEFDNHYYRALELGRAIKREFGKPLGEITRDEISNMPLSTFTDLVQEVSEKRLSEISSDFQISI